MDVAAKKNLAPMISRDGVSKVPLNPNPNPPKPYIPNSISDAERRATMSARPTSLDFEMELQSRANRVMPARPARPAPSPREKLEQSGNSRAPTTLRRVGESGDLRGANTSTPTNANAVPIGPRSSAVSRTRASTVSQQGPPSTSQPAIVNKTDIPRSFGAPRPFQKLASPPPSTPTASQLGSRDQHPSSSHQKQQDVTPPSTKITNTKVNGSHKRDNGSMSSGDEGGDIRTSQPLRKRAKHAVDPNHIGHHVDDDHLRVYAKIKPQLSEKGTQQIDLYVIRKPDRLSSTHVDDRHTVEIIHVSKAVLSSTVFPAHANELQGMKSDKKLGIIKEYLLTLEKEVEQDEDDMSTYTGSPAKYRYVPECLEIGYHRDDTDVPAQACVRLYGNNLTPTVAFKVLKEHGKDSNMDFSIRSVKDTNKILFKPEFRGPSMQGTRMKILSHFTRQEVEIKREESQTPSKKSSLSPYNETPSSSEDSENGGDTIIVRARPPTLATYAPSGEDGLAVDNAIAALRNAENQLLSSHRNLSEGIAELAKEKSAVEARDSKIKRKVEAYEELEKRIRSREEAVKKLEILEAREKTLRDLEENINAREKGIGGQEAVTKSLIDLEKKEKDLKDWQDEKRTLEINLRERRDAVKKREDECNSRAASLAERDNFLTARETKTAALDKEMRERYTALASNESKVKQREVEVLRKETAASQQPIASPPPPFSLTIPLSLSAKTETKFQFEKSYVKIPLGHPNAGMYARRAPEKLVVIEGKRFAVNRFLQEFTGPAGPILDPNIEVDGKQIPGIIAYAGLQLLKYEKDGMLKLVQKFGNKSLYFFEARFFVSWYVYKEVEDRVDYTI
ncbi:hypothetical protein ACEPPN_014664 [Leptodophora sp. 'Broadleaf-Isolate-01']